MTQNRYKHISDSAPTPLEL